MPLRILAFAFLGLSAMVVPALAQTQHPLRGQEPSNGAIEPDQPVRPEDPKLAPRGSLQPIGRQLAQPGQYPQERPQPGQGQQLQARPQPPKPPFPPLTPQEEALVDRVLNLWEKRNLDVKTFDCRFKRWVYDSVFGTLEKPMFEEWGIIKFAAPDKGLFKIEESEKDGKRTPIEDARAEHWMSDGKAIFEYSPLKKQVAEHKLPPELQGKAIANTPLPFLFGSEAKILKQRYFIRIVPPPDSMQDKICIEAYPRYQQDAGNFKKAQFMITKQKMEPFALMLVQPNGKDYTAYQFYEIATNSWNPFGSNPFRVFVPRGWQLIPDQQPAQAQRMPNDGRR